MIEFKMPSLGADMEDGILREWKVKPGDAVKRGDIIAEVEVQKGNIEIECFDDGTIEQLLIKENEKVPVGSVMALIKPLTEMASTTPKGEDKVMEQPAIPTKRDERTETILQDISTAEIKASPMARRLAAENKIDLYSIQGTGEDGAITRDDVEKWMGSRPAQAPETKSSLSPAENVRLAVAAAMSKSNREIPHYYLEKKTDVTNAIAWLAKANAERSIQKRLLPAVLFIRAIAKALLEVPDLNAVWENGLQRKEGIHIGFVVSLKSGGIIVPAIHEADKKSMDEIMVALNDIIPRARALKLRSSELSDSTITLTNLGEGGADKVYGIIYPPQVAIIGIGDILKETVFRNGVHEEHAFVYITLAGDHRATDGLTGSKFLAALNNSLQQPEIL